MQFAVVPAHRAKSAVQAFAAPRLLPSMNAWHWAQVLQADPHSLCLKLRAALPAGNDSASPQIGTGWLWLCWHPHLARLCIGAPPRRGSAAEGFAFGMLPSNNTLPALLTLRVMLVHCKTDGLISNPCWVATSSTFRGGSSFLHCFFCISSQLLVTILASAVCMLWPGWPLFWIYPKHR